MQTLTIIGIIAQGAPIAAILIVSIFNRKYIAKQLGPFYTGKN